MQTKSLARLNFLITQKSFSHNFKKFSVEFWVTKGSCHSQIGSQFKPYIYPKFYTNSKFFSYVQNWQTQNNKVSNKIGFLFKTKFVFQTWHVPSFFHLCIVNKPHPPHPKILGIIIRKTPILRTLWNLRYLWLVQELMGF